MSLIVCLPVSIGTVDVLMSVGAAQNHSDFVLGKGPVVLTLELQIESVQRDSAPGTGAQVRAQFFSPLELDDAGVSVTEYTVIAGAEVQLVRSIATGVIEEKVPPWGSEIESRPWTLDRRGVSVDRPTQLNPPQSGLENRTLDGGHASFDGEETTVLEVLVEAETAEIDLVVIQWIERRPF